ncbi:hypothetical protein [Kitasatospora sp. GP82]|uniref:hypothetical protein n=1 Tax=Kitasatospora sp. GP82 TaxID=3035089 RepID=UPI002472F1CF|nr:hypothetical protein [Kitasatospora sp. GP82]MDH6123338.1 hypothetical protein [Kitasatospora sp. GP82]
MTAETIAQTPARPTLLLLGAAITALEGAALAGWGSYDMISGLTGDSAALGRSEAGGLVLLLMGLFPLLAGWALLRLRRWGRSPAVLTNSICLPVAYYMWQGGGAMKGVAVVVALLGLVAIGSLLNPKVTALLYRSQGD